MHNKHIALYTYSKELQRLSIQNDKRIEALAKESAFLGRQNRDMGPAFAPITPKDSAKKVFIKTLTDKNAPVVTLTNKRKVALLTHLTEAQAEFLQSHHPILAYHIDGEPGIIKHKGKEKVYPDSHGTTIGFGRVDAKTPIDLDTGNLPPNQENKYRKTGRTAISYGSFKKVIWGIDVSTGQVYAVCKQYLTHRERSATRVHNALDELTLNLSDVDNGFLHCLGAGVIQKKDTDFRPGRPPITADNEHHHLYSIYVPGISFSEILPYVQDNRDALPLLQELFNATKRSIMKDQISRDTKSRNMLVTLTGEVALIDSNGSGPNTVTKGGHSYLQFNRENKKTECHNKNPIGSLPHFLPESQFKPRTQKITAIDEMLFSLSHVIFEWAELNLPLINGVSFGQDFHEVKKFITSQQLDKAEETRYITELTDIYRKFEIPKQNLQYNPNEKLYIGPERRACFDLVSRIMLQKIESKLKTAEDPDYRMVLNLSRAAVYLQSPSLSKENPGMLRIDRFKGMYKALNAHLKDRPNFKDAAFARIMDTMANTHNAPPLP